MRCETELAKALVCPHIRACFPSRLSLRMPKTSFKSTNRFQELMGHFEVLQLMIVKQKVINNLNLNQEIDHNIMMNYVPDPNVNRRILNIGPHGQNFNLSINQRADENLNNSNRYDYNFDQSIEDRASSRGHQDNNVNINFKRSQTDYLKSQSQQQQVHFVTADVHQRNTNHPLHQKQSNRLEKIDERKSQSPSGKPKNQRNVNNNDISNITINSKNNLEESLRAPGRPPKRIEELTNFLVESHYKKFGVYSKVEGELFKYWKEHVSAGYREQRKRKAALNQSKIEDNNDFIGTSQSQTLLKKNTEKRKEGFSASNGFLLLEKFGQCYEIDVAYTLQQDFKEESERMAAQREQLKNQRTQDREKMLQDQEEKLIKHSCDLYYQDKLELLVWCSQRPDLASLSEDDKLKKWYKAVIDWELPALNEATIDKLLKPNQASSAKKEESNPFLAEDTAVIQEKKRKEEEEKKQGEEAKKAKQEEEKKKSEDMKALRAGIKAELDKEQQFISHLFMYIRKRLINSKDSDLPNDPEVAYTMYDQCKERAQNNLILAGKNDAAIKQIIARFFRRESIVRRLQLLYKQKLSSKGVGKYGHLSLFGFYLQLPSREKQLYLIDVKLVKSQDQNSHENSFKTLLDQAYQQAVKQHQEDPVKMTRAQQETLDDQIQTQMHVNAVSLNNEKLVQAFGDVRPVSLHELINACENYYRAESNLRSWVHQMRQKLKLKGYQERNLEGVIGKEKKLHIEKQKTKEEAMKRIGELAKPKDKWKRLHILLELKQIFKHDITLKKMIQEELKSNRIFKYPEEYDLYDNEEDKLCKVRPKIDEKEDKPMSYGTKKEPELTLREQFLKEDKSQFNRLKMEIQNQRSREAKFNNFLLSKALKYLEEKKKRLNRDSGSEVKSIRDFVSEIYHQISKDYPDIVKARFPHITYGQDQMSKTFLKSFPSTFKNYFFKIVKSYFRQKKGMKRILNPAPTFIISSGRSRCLMHENITCPEGCTYSTFNKKVILKSQRIKKLFKEPDTFRSRVWRRKDLQDKLDKVLMLNSEKENCFFEPEAGSMSLTIDLALKANPSLRKDGFLAEPDPKAFVEKMGDNLQKSNPEVYKKGILKRAWFLYNKGLYEDAMNKLCTGFNIDSILIHYDKKKGAKKVIASGLSSIIKSLSKKREEEAKQQESHMSAIEQMKEKHETQKHMPAENFDNIKLMPILDEAHQLIIKLHKRKAEIQAKISNIKRNKREIDAKIRSYSQYKRSQSRNGGDGNEFAMYKTIMCPLRDKCPHDIRPRWPTSNTKSITKFGNECPFAHHPMELKFPQSLSTSASASTQSIKTLTSKLEKEDVRKVFKISGPFFECQGCNGKCNLCKYKHEGLLLQKKQREYSKHQRSTSKYKKLESKYLIDEESFAKKFGLLKKGCVLYFYGRYGDAFDQIADAAEIVRAQREQEKQEQQTIERRWKFKLGMDEGFEFPIPLDQIDPNKVDEKMLKKLDLQGMSVATLKLYLEQVCPQNREEYSKHKFLNKCIEDFYLQSEAMLTDKTNTIAKMKKQVEALNTMADDMEAFGIGAESSPERSPEKGGDGEDGKRYKPKKTKMCKDQVDNHRCQTQIAYRTQSNHIIKQHQRTMSHRKEDQEKETNELNNELQKLKKCNLAHTPIELDLIPVETKVRNLQGVIQSQTLKLKDMKPLEPWRPVKSGDIIHTHLMDMTSKGRKRKGADGEEEEEKDKKRAVTKKSVFDRENIHRKPFEVNE